MLARLRVEGYAIIEDIEIALAPGLNVLTGETGAGKSIIVGALGFVLGDRVSGEVVRKGRDTCRVEALFRLEEPALEKVKQLLPAVEVRDGVVCLEREISRGGRSKSALNERRVPLPLVRELGDLLVDFHGQHEHQRLLDARSHMEFLDGFAHLVPLKDSLGERRQELLGIVRRMEDLEKEIAYIDKQEDFIRYEVREIEQMNLKEGEEEDLEHEIALLAHAEKIAEAGTAAMEAIYDGDDAAILQLSRGVAQLGKIGAYSEDLAGLAESLEQAELQVKELAETLRDYLGGIDLDPDHLENLRERQVAIDRIKRKYGKSIPEVLEHLKRLRQRLENKEDLYVELSDLKSEKQRLTGEVLGLARDLSARRHEASEHLEKLVQPALKMLGLGGGFFRIVFEDLEEGEELEDGEGGKYIVGENGIDAAEFFVRTNKGEDLLPLRRVASGGEVSRVMLALKSILAEADRVETMIFDEIDAGIGGGMADVVARKLREVAGSRQVVCITHLPQIAAPADLHLAVGKVTAGGRTKTEVKRVEGEARVEELVRMLGGRKAPDAARLHAEEILKRAVAK
jgi:DNA repair protein RecN (Recombination protein N)